MAQRQGQGKGKKGSRKYGRNKIKCEKYRKANRREENKARKEAKRLRRFAKRKIKIGGLNGI